MGRKLLAALLAAMMLTATALAAETEDEEFPQEGPVTVEEQEEAGQAEPSEEAGEEPELIVTEHPMELLEPVQMTFASSDDPDTVSLFDGDVAAWSGTRYYDQLNTDDKKIYDALETAFKTEGGILYTPEEYTDPQTKKTTTLYLAKYVNEQFLVTDKIIVEGADPGNEKGQALVSERLSAEAAKYDLQRALFAFTMDHPEYFWIRMATFCGFGMRIGWETYTRGDVVEHIDYTGTLTVNASFNMLDASYLEAETRDGLADQVEDTVQAILSRTEDVPTVAKLAYFDEWLAANKAYNRPAGDTGATGIYDPLYMDYAHKGPNCTAPWNITGAFVSTLQPVCEGYAKAFQLLCHRIGLNCITVSSENHMWNMVQLEDGQWYNVDCTWNDPNMYKEGENGEAVFDKSSEHSNRNYFLISRFKETTTENNERNESHDVHQIFLVPQAAEADYFNDAMTNWYVDIESQSAVRNSGGLLAIYDEGDKLLQVQEGCSIAWGDHTTRLITPELPENLMDPDYSCKIFTFGEGYKPSRAVKEVQLISPST